MNLLKHQVTNHLWDNNTINLLDMQDNIGVIKCWENKELSKQNNEGFGADLN